MDVIKSEEPAFPTDLGYLFAPPSTISGVGDDSSLDHLLNLDQFDLTSATLADDDAGVAPFGQLHDLHPAPSRGESERMG